jgi:predicted nucleic-acid-binding protein
MPYFDQQIDVDEFLYGCTKSEIQEVIDNLIERGNLPESVKNMSKSSVQYSVAESEFEDALHKLHGKWNSLSKEEEQTIIKISKRF